MEKEIEELKERLKGLNGKTRGVGIMNTAAYIKEKEGEEGIHRIEEEMAKLGHPMKLGEIKDDQWYPPFIDPMIMIIAKNIFGWTEEDFYDAGYFAPQVSPIAKMFLRMFFSVETAFKASSKYWSKYFTFGSLEPIEFNARERYMVLRQKDFDLHPLACAYHKGYFARIVHFTVGQDKEIDVEENACTHKGDPYHEFTIKWR